MTVPPISDLEPDWDRVIDTAYSEGWAEGFLWGVGLSLTGVTFGYVIWRYVL